MGAWQSTFRRGSVRHATCPNAGMPRPTDPFRPRWPTRQIGAALRGARPLNAFGLHALAMAHLLARGPLWWGAGVLLLFEGGPDRWHHPWAIAMLGGLVAGVQRIFEGKLYAAHGTLTGEIGPTLSPRTILVASAMAVLLSHLDAQATGPLWTLVFMVAVADVQLVGDRIEAVLRRAGVGALTGMLAVSLIG